MTQSVPTDRPTTDNLLRILITLIGLHSCILGSALLFAPRFTLRIFGMPESGSMFFSSQNGLFLIILGVCYLMALRDRAFVIVIIVSKSLAVAFLGIHVLFLDAPALVGAATVIDASMLTALLVLLCRDS